MVGVDLFTLPREYSKFFAVARRKVRTSAHTRFSFRATFMAATTATSRQCATSTHKQHPNEDVNDVKCALVSSLYSGVKTEQVSLPLLQESKSKAV